MQSNTADNVRTALSRRGRWGVGEIAFWLVAAATLFFLPERHLILNEIAIITSPVRSERSYASCMLPSAVSSWMRLSVCCSA